MNRTLTRILVTCLASLVNTSLVRAAPALPPPAGGGLQSASSASLAPAIGLEAKIITVNPRLSHHKGRQLRVFIRNRGATASARGSIRLRAHRGKQPYFITSTQALPAIAPGGEVSMTFPLPRHLRALPPVNQLDVVASLPGGPAVLPPFSLSRLVPQPPAAPAMGADPYLPPVQK